MSSDTSLDFFQEDFALFIETGFIAVKQLDEIAARRLFKAAELLKPESSAPRLGLGYIELNKMRAVEAAHIFESILEKEPKHALAKALLGVSYIMTKDKKKQGEEILKTAKQESDDPTIQNLVDVTMQWMQKDLKTAQTIPFVPSLEGSQE